MENKAVTNKTRKQSRTELDKVMRKIDSEVPEDSPFEEESVLADSSHPKKQKKLPISTILEIAKMINFPEKIQKTTVSLDTTNDEETQKVPHGTEPALDPHKGQVQVTTINLLSTIQHPVDSRKIEQLVSNYEQQYTNGAKLKPIASFLSETAREGMQLRVEARLSTANPPEVTRKPLMDMSPQDMLQVARLLYPASVMAVNSGSSQALAEVSKPMLTHSKYAEWETAALNTNAIVRAHSHEPTDQKRSISQIVKAIRDAHKGTTHEAEASRILSKITTAQLTGTFAEFYGAILSNFMSNGGLYRSSL